MEFILKKECIFCNNTFTTYQKLRKHIDYIHGYILEARNKSQQNRNAVPFTKKNIKQYPDATICYGCPSCSKFYEEKNDLQEHALQEHVLT